MMMIDVLLIMTLTITDDDDDDDDDDEHIETNWLTCPQNWPSDA